MIFIVAIVAFCGCNSASRQDSNCKTFPVIALLSRVDCTWFEDSILNEKSGIGKMGKVFLNFILTNPNDSPIALPVCGTYGSDTLYKSNIEVYRKGHKLDSENIYSNKLVLNGREQCFITVKIEDISKTGYNGFKDIKKAVAALDFVYIENKADSMYFKEKIGRMNFYIDNALDITYREPESFGRSVMYR